MILFITGVLSFCAGVVFFVFADHLNPFTKKSVKIGKLREEELKLERKLYIIKSKRVKLMEEDFRK